MRQPEREGEREGERERVREREKGREREFEREKLTEGDRESHVMWWWVLLGYVPDELISVLLM
jgi:hypothetical protein